MNVRGASVVSTTWTASAGTPAAAARSRTWATAPAVALTTTVLVVTSTYQDGTVAATGARAVSRPVFQASRSASLWRATTGWAPAARTAGASAASTTPTCRTFLVV